MYWSSNSGNAASTQVGQDAPADLRSIVRKARRGDQDASAELIAALYPVVIKIVRAYLPRRSSEEDLAQMVFLRVFHKLGQYSGEVPVTHWVSRIAVNTCLNEIAREKVRPELRYADLSEEHEEVLETLLRTPPEAHPARSLAARDLVEQLLASLNPADRLVLTLMYLEEKSVAEIKAITGWNTALIKVRAFRAREKLRKHLKHLLEDPA